MPEMPAVFEQPVARAPRGITVLAWLVILAGCVAMMVVQYLSKSVEAGGAEGEDKLGLVVMKMQAQYIVATNEMGGGGLEMLYEQADQTLNLGSVGQRQRYVVVAGELEGDEKAVEVLNDLVALMTTEVLATEDDEKPFVVTAEQERVNEILRRRYENPETPISDDDRVFLETQLDWFAELALAGEDDRADVLAPAQRVLAIFLSAFFAGGGGAFVGFVGLVALIVLTLIGRVQGNVPAAPTHHGIYAETFALWLWLFLGMQFVAALPAAMVPQHAIIITAVAFFASMVALGWPVLRGVPWRQVREDIGLTLGRQPALEPVIGVAGYLMGLPMLVAGVSLTYLLLLVDQSFGSAAGGPPFGAGGGPAHPVIQELAGPSWWPKIQVLIVAAVAAPIVEETMFRGVLYRHLRDASRGASRLVSVLLSATISGFVFAIIHPQGWIAVPVLMSLAYAFCLVREWRGTLIPAMVVHGISNGLVMTLLILVVGG
jgi:membrane protease YdiL (CAAX protease family)